MVETGRGTGPSQICLPLEGSVQSSETATEGRPGSNSLQNKAEGAVIYGVDYLSTAPEPDQTPKDQLPDKGQ